jgi:hypothetical protein
MAFFFVFGGFDFMGRRTRIGDFEKQPCRVMHHSARPSRAAVQLHPLAQTHPLDHTLKVITLHRQTMANLSVQ